MANEIYTNITELPGNLVISVESPHQKVLRHSGLIIHALDNLAIMGNWTPDLQMVKSV